MALALLSALEAIHAKNYLHRDLKPQNILLEAAGLHPVLIDFGNARISTGEKTKSVTAVVSPGYAPFEQYQTRSKQGPWTDLYSLGAVLYRAITGQSPPEATDRIEADPMPPAQRFTNRGFSPKFLATIDKALRPKGTDRWQSATAWKQALLSLPAPAPKPATSPKKPLSPPNPLKAKRGAYLGLALGAAGLMLLLIALTMALWDRKSSPNNQTVAGNDQGSSTKSKASGQTEPPAASPAPKISDVAQHPEPPPGEIDNYPVGWVVPPVPPVDKINIISAAPPPNNSS